MTAKTHIFGGVVAAELLCMTVGVQEPRVVMPCCVVGAVGALLPDIDHTGSRISRSLIFTHLLSVLLSALTEHRGIIHTPLFVLVFTAAAVVLSAGLNHALLYSAVLGVGMLSHLVLDTLNPSGIMWAWPIRREHYSLANIRTDSLAEYLVFVLLLALAAVLADHNYIRLWNDVCQALAQLLPALADAARRMTR